MKNVEVEVKQDVYVDNKVMSDGCMVSQKNGNELVYLKIFEDVTKNKIITYDDDSSSSRSCSNIFDWSSIPQCSTLTTRLFIPLLPNIVCQEDDVTWRCIDRTIFQQPTCIPRASHIVVIMFHVQSRELFALRNFIHRSEIYSVLA